MRTVQHTPRGVRRAEGKARRNVVPRSAHAIWNVPADRPDPVALLERSNATRIPELVAVRHGRMIASPFGFMRGSPIVMNGDLARTPVTGYEAQLCGDAHLLNFGVYATPERHLAFDLNDFDETLPGPWEWDLKRLAVSLAVAARDRAFTSADAENAVREAVGAYRRRMLAMCQVGNLEVWYSHVDVDDALGIVEASQLALVRRGALKARRRTNLTALPKLTEVVDGRRRIIDDPPLITHEPISDGDEDVALAKVLASYRSSLPDDRRLLLDRYQLVDVARKVVGVGSVGTRCAVALFVGNGGHDPLFLQVKEAEASVLEPLWRRSRYRNHGRRVVEGQHLMQAASDIFLGWTVGPYGHHFYIRQLRDMKGSVDLAGLSPGELGDYGALCGTTLARAHARSGDAARISGYLGTGSVFDDAMVVFVNAYADQVERDHQALVDAVAAGRVAAETGV